MNLCAHMHNRGHRQWGGEGPGVGVDNSGLEEVNGEKVSTYVILSTIKIFKKDYLEITLV